MPTHLVRIPRMRRGERRRARRKERRRITALLRAETVGGALLVAAAVAALVLANSPLAHLYGATREWRIGPARLDLHLSIGEWTAEGLLALFFFLAGLELKQEFAAGELRGPRRAVVPVVAAIAGMAVPAVVYVVITSGVPGAHIGWAIPTATDIAFALAILAVVGRHLPPALRTFLLTLAVVDDLLAIGIIAVAYTAHVDVAQLAIAIAAVIAFAVLIQRARRWWVTRWLLLPGLALLTWAAMHGSGVHPTVAGVLLGFAVPVLGRRAPAPRRSGSADGGDVVLGRERLPAPDLAGRLDHVLRPISAGIAVPLFAFFAAGVSVRGGAGLGAALESRITLGIVAGLVVGKALGIFAATMATARLVRSPLLRAARWPDLAGLAVLGGVGFTVSLLIGQLAFGTHPTRAADAQIGVAAGSFVAASLAALWLGVRNRHYRRLSIGGEPTQLRASTARSAQRPARSLGRHRNSRSPALDSRRRR